MVELLLLILVITTSELRSRIVPDSIYLGQNLLDVRQRPSFPDAVKKNQSLNHFLKGRKRTKNAMKV